MFGSNFFSQNNIPLSQSSINQNYHNTQFIDFQNYQKFPYPQNQQTNNISSQYNTQNNLNPKNESFDSQFIPCLTQKQNNNYLNQKQFENIFYENMKLLPNKINEILNNPNDNVNIQSLFNDLDNNSSITNEKINYINKNFCEKLTDSNNSVEKFCETCKNIENILNNINSELLNHFSLFTSFHGYDESLQNVDKNFENIHNEIQKCNYILLEEIIGTNNKILNYNNDININLEQFKLILTPEIKKISEYLIELANCKKKENTTIEEYQKITNNILGIISQIKMKFIFINEISKKKILEKDEYSNYINNDDNNNKENENINTNNKVVDGNSNVNNINCIECNNKKATLNYLKNMHRKKKGNKINTYYC